MDRIVHDIKDAAATTGIGGAILAFVHGVSAYDVAMKAFQLILVALMVVHVALRILKAYADWQDYRADGGTLFGRRRVPTRSQAGRAGTKEGPGSSDEE